MHVHAYHGSAEKTARAVAENKAHFVMQIQTGAGTREFHFSV